MTLSTDGFAYDRPQVQKAGPVRQIIGGIDQRLSRNQGVKPFSHDERCILRYALLRSPWSFSLSDGSRVERGDPVIDIHCWNERVPPMPSSGPELAWAQDISKRLRYSLRLLAAEMITDPALQPARACRARVNFVGRGCSNESVSRIIGRLGFEDINEGPSSSWALIHDQLENVLTAALVWTYNPKALRRDKMVREKRPVWASRETLLQRYAGTAVIVAKTPEGLAYRR
ncbi:YkoP family protein [Lichenifustis flavocetrariae]|uniref:YkoP-like domain-containing protein n=1 Tax=Lichenifustis flavocetrariae TaxID=2949735 RepID=A0AA41YZ44_9HYPH|nr:hypothetical protein [Lichenifustis flavocetrariae]MCW6509892.1 hypothetical protein [Lichenifustis flavocetrariae]